MTEDPRGERLQKVMARAGVASRRASEDLIRAGRVTVDGAVAELGQRVTAAERIAVDGEPVERRVRHRTLVLHKPDGVVVTAHDPQGRPTVFDLVPAIDGLHPVGRLDMDSEGLQLLTTDGELTLRLTHPRYGHRKEYRVWCVEGGVADEALARLERGVDLDDGPARALVARPASGGAVITLEEGRNRQVRRMFEAVGYRVERLLRTRIDDLPLGDLAPGSWREVGPEDLARLGYTPGDSGPSGAAHGPGAG